MCAGVSSGAAGPHADEQRCDKNGSAEPVVILAHLRLFRLYNTEDLPRNAHVILTILCSDFDYMNKGIDPKTLQLVRHSGGWDSNRAALCRLATRLIAQEGAQQPTGAAQVWGGAATGGAEGGIPLPPCCERVWKRAYCASILLYDRC